MVRVLSRHASSRALLRGHTESIVELGFFENVGEAALSSSGDRNNENASDLLASTAKDGNIFLWKIESPSAESVVPTLVLNIFSTIKKGAGYFHRVRWHPSDPNVLAAVSVEPGGGIYIFNIASLLTIAQTKPNSQCDIDQLDESTGVRILNVPGSTVVQDVAFSPNGALLAAGSDDGKIRVWDLQSKECIYDWLDNEDTGSSSPSAISSILFPCNSVLVTSTHKNSTIHLWNLPPQHTTQPTSLQSIAFTSQTKEFLGHLSFDPTGSFLFMASVNLCVGFIIHLDAAGGRANKDKDNRTQTPKFDYLTEFEVTQPILSFTVGLQTNVPQQPKDDEEESTDSKENVMQLFCVQTKAIQIHQTSTEQCYSASKQAQEEDVSGPVTQTGKIGESLGESDDVLRVNSSGETPALSSSAETRLRQTEEYNQHQQHLWLAHSVETRRDSYVPEEYQDPAFSPHATPDAPAFATQQPKITEQPLEAPISAESHADKSSERALEVTPQSEGHHEQSQQPTHEQTADQQKSQERPQEHPERELQNHTQDSEPQPQEHDQNTQVQTQQPQPESIEHQPKVPQTQLPIDTHENRPLHDPISYQTQERGTEHDEKSQIEQPPNPEKTESQALPSQPNATVQAKPTKARGGRGKKDNTNVPTAQNDTASPTQTPLPAPFTTHQPKQKSAAPVAILHRNAHTPPATAQIEETRSVSPFTSAPVGQDDLRRLEANMMSSILKTLLFLS